MYNGISSEEMGLYNVSTDNGMYKEVFLADKKIVEEKVMGNNKPYFMGIEREPLSFSLTFAFMHPFDSEKKREVARWLNQDYYRELYFLDNPNRRWLCMPISDSNIVHNGLGAGYLEMEFRCDSPYTHSEEYLTEELDFSVSNPSNGAGMTYEFKNLGDMPLKPEMWIKKIGVGDVIIENKADGTIFKFTGLANGEYVYIDNEREEIMSDYTELTGVYRYDNFNNNYLEMEYGRNILNIKGECKIQFRFRYKTIQG